MSLSVESFSDEDLAENSYVLRYIQPGIPGDVPASTRAATRRIETCHSEPISYKGMAKEEIWWTYGVPQIGRSGSQMLLVGLLLGVALAVMAWRFWRDSTYSRRRRSRESCSFRLLDVCEHSVPAGTAATGSAPPRADLRLAGRFLETYRQST